MSTSMERDGRVRSPSPPPSPRQPALSLLASLEAKRSPAIAATEYTVYVGVTATAGMVPLRLDRRYPLFGGSADITFAVSIAVGTFMLTGQVAVTLNIQAEALLPFGATRKHLLWSLTWMIRIYANCVHTRRL